MIEGLVKIAGSIFVGGAGLILIGLGIVVLLVIVDEFRNKWKW